MGLPYLQTNTVIEALVKVFVNDRTLQCNDTTNPANFAKGQKTYAQKVNTDLSYFGKRLQTVAKAIFIVYVEDLKSYVEGGKWNKFKN